MATVDVIPTQSHKLIPNRKRFTPYIDVGRGPGGWFWRLRLTCGATDVMVRWRGPFSSPAEAFTAGLVNFNTVCTILDGPDGQRFKAALEPILDAFGESAERR